MEIQKPKEILIIHETAFESFTKDFVSFAVLLGGLYFNFRYIGNNWFVSFVFVIMFLVMMLSRAARLNQRANCTSEAEAIKRVREIYRKAREEGEL